MSANVIDGKQIAGELVEDIRQAVERRVAMNRRPPGLAMILVGDNPASRVYVSNKERACARSGIRSFLHALAADTAQPDLLDLIQTLNADPEVDGILVQLPLPGHLHTERVLEAVSPDKDVDGFHARNTGLLMQGRPQFIPCTPYGLWRLRANMFRKGN